MITVFTATYNRAYSLPKLYKSLIEQTDKDFEWLIVDDGSTDDTEKLVKDYINDDSKLNIRYVKKENGGKHTAINVGVKEAKGDWFFMVDSDDWLSHDAISILKTRTASIENDHSFCGITALRVNRNGNEIGDICKYDILDVDSFSYRYKLRIKGDRAECIRTSVMREFPFPVFGNEKFIPESIIWVPMAMKYKMRYTNDKIYICEYLNDGLTKSGNSIFLKSPVGTAYDCCIAFSHPHLPLFERILFSVRYLERIGQAKKIGSAIPQCVEMPARMRKYIPIAALLLKFKSPLVWLRDRLLR